MTDISNRRTWRRPPFIKNPTLRWTLIVGAAAYLAAAIGTTEVNWTRVLEGLPRGQRFLSGFSRRISLPAGMRSSTVFSRAFG